MNQKGFAAIFIAIPLILLVIVGFFIFSQKYHPSSGSLSDSASQHSNNSSDLNSIFSQGKCQGQNRVNFGVPIMKPEDVAYFIPLGTMVKGHVTPIDHQYYYPLVGPARNVYSPADGVIVQLSVQNNQIEKHLKDQNYDQYDVVIEHSCKIYSRLGLLSSVADKILEEAGGLEKNSKKAVRIPIRAGEVVGNVSNHSLDVWVYDADITLTGFIRPDHYQEEGKMQSVSVFDYYVEPIKASQLALDLRKADPRGGKIDYDIDGKLVGNWFVEGTNGYQGIERDSYWRSHLSFVYNVFDPNHLMISIGTFNGENDGYQFGVKGNIPDPKNVSMGTGMVKYELVSSTDFFESSGKRVNPFEKATDVVVENNDSHIAGVMLVQMTEKRKIKVETFLGKTADQVTGFTNNPQIYER
jgi:hypothetical protein